MVIEKYYILKAKINIKEDYSNDITLKDISLYLDKDFRRGILNDLNTDPNVKFTLSEIK